jgi:hypothetical protein
VSTFLSTTCVHLLVYSHLLIYLTLACRAEIIRDYKTGFIGVFGPLKTLAVLTSTVLLFG